MTDSSTEDQPQADDAGITDEHLPEDLRPSEENPLAQPLDDEVALEDLDVHGEARRAVGRRAARGLSDVIGHRPVRRVIRARARAAT